MLALCQLRVQSVIVNVLVDRQPGGTRKAWRFTTRLLRDPENELVSERIGYEDMRDIAIDRARTAATILCEEYGLRAPQLRELVNTSDLWHFADENVCIE